MTGYFDLTRKADASPEIRKRPVEHYIDRHAGSTLRLDNNLVVFCEPELEAKVWSIRPAHLHARTRVITMSFEDFPLTKYRDRIVENRGGPWCPTDPRNTASYYLFCMARYAMLKQAIADNRFGSTHFAWINICIERMGLSNLAHLNEALGQQRDRFSTCWIDYVSRETVEDARTYFGDGGCRNCRARCSMCSGFFTGSAHYMREVCDRLEAEFLRCMEAGYGHADEQLYPIVYYKNPELFEWYCGDYTEMITNYARVYEHPERPIRNLIRNSLAAGDIEVARRACEIVMRSHMEGKCVVEQGDLALVESTMLSPARRRYLSLLKSCLTRTAFERLSPEQLALRNIGNDWPKEAETMIGHARLDNIEHCAGVVLREGIPGDFLEAGVWRGGASIFMRALIDEHPDRVVWVADSFEGLPPPSAEFPEDLAGRYSSWASLAVSQEEVASNFRRYDLLDDRVRFIKGWFRDTLPGPVTKLALLRLDGDMYESTTQTLNALYDLVSPGGFIIIDDYAGPEARAATDSFRAERNIKSPLNRADWTAVWWRKEKEVEC